MSFMLWHAGALQIGSDRRVYRAAELPQLADADALAARLDALLRSEDARIADAEAAARQAGLAEGAAAAARSAEAALLEHLDALTRSFDAERAQLQQSVAALALEVARHLLGSLPSYDALALLAQQAARELLPARPWRVAAAPGDTDALRASLQAMDAEHPSGLHGVELCVDAALVPGTCRIETQYGSALVGVDTQLQRIATAWGVVQ